MIYAAKTTVGQESMVIDMIKSKVKEESLEVYSLGSIPGFKGYVLIEAIDELMARRAITGVSNVKAKGLLPGTINVNELTILLEAKPLMQAIKEGQKVELVSGPFKGEKAKVIRVNETKEEVTVELLEAAVKIPVTIHASNIKILSQD